MFRSKNKQSFTADPNILDTLKRHVWYLHGKLDAYRMTATDTGVFEVSASIVRQEIDFLERLISQYEPRPRITQGGSNICPE